MWKSLIKFMLVTGIILMLVVVGCAPKAAPGGKPEVFYPGKTLTIMVPFAAGGSYDQWARALAPYLQKYTGATVLVQNMEGAGELGGGDWLYNTAKPDGLSLLMLGPDALGSSEITLTPGVRYKAEKFEYISQVDKQWYAVTVSKVSGMKSIADLQKAAKVRFGAISVGGPPVVFATLFAEAFGIKAKIVAGYKGSTAYWLALTAGKEIDALCSTVAGKEEITVKEQGLPVLAFCASARNPRFPDVPTLLETPGLSSEGKKLLQIVAAIADVSGRSLIAPPGTPKDRVAFLEKGVQAASKDPALIQWAEKAQMNQASATSAELKERLNKLMKLVPEADWPKMKQIVFEKYL